MKIDFFGLKSNPLSDKERFINFFCFFMGTLGYIIMCIDNYKKAHGG